MMSDQDVTENREDSLEESDPENLARTLTIGRSDDYGRSDDEYVGDDDFYDDDDLYGDDGFSNSNADVGVNNDVEGLVRSSTWRQEEIEVMEKHAAKENASIKDIMRELDNLILFPKPSFREREAVKTMFYRVKAKLEKDRRMKAVDDLQKEILDVKGSLDKVNEKIAVEQTKNAKPISKAKMDGEIAHEIEKERQEIKGMVNKRLQALKDRVAKVMAKYGTVLEPSSPVSA